MSKQSRTRAPSFVIVSGLSGSGKSFVLKCFEDLGFFCVDNLPPPLLPTFAELCTQSSFEIARVALGVDIREREFLDLSFTIFDALTVKGHPLELIFLEARDEVLVRRFSESRRPHPLAKEGPVIEGIRLERKRLEGLRSRADRILDTSDYTVHQLKELIGRIYGEGGGRRLTVNLISFGYKFGIPFEADLVFDVRFLKNPNFIESLKPLPGTDPRVIEYVHSAPPARAFLQHLRSFLELLIPLYEKEGRSYLTIAIGCTGGRHRSVAVARLLEDMLKQTGYEPSVRHRDIER